MKLGDMSAFCSFSIWCILPCRVRAPAANHKLLSRLKLFSSPLDLCHSKGLSLHIVSQWQILHFDTDPREPRLKIKRSVLVSMSRQGFLTWRTRRCRRPFLGRPRGCRSRSGLRKGWGNRRKQPTLRRLSAVGCWCPSACKVWSWRPPSPE